MTLPASDTRLVTTVEMLTLVPIVDKQVTRSVMHSEGIWAYSRKENAAHIFGYQSRLYSWRSICSINVPEAKKVFHASNSDHRRCKNCLRLKEEEISMREGAWHRMFLGSGM